VGFTSILPDASVPTISIKSVGKRPNQRSGSVLSNVERKSQFWNKKLLQTIIDSLGMFTHALTHQNLCQPSYNEKLKQLRFFIAMNLEGHRKDTERTPEEHHNQTERIPKHRNEIKKTSEAQ